MPLDDYDVIREIRRGEHAVVRLARETAGGRLVVLRTFDTGDAEALERFRRELETIARLDHPGIATVLEVFEDGDSATVVTEWVEAGSLRGVIGELSPEQVAGVVEELLDAVGVAADAGVVHLGLKPENVLITTDGHTQVADFGIASVAWHDTALTRAGGPLRDLSYISPEQVRGELAGPSTDLYAIGCMTYEMLTGRPPFQSDSKLGLAMAHLESPLPDPLEADPTIPAPMARWVARMTEKDPADRFPDAAAAREALERAVEEAAQAPPAPAPAMPAAVPEPEDEGAVLLAGLRQGARAGVAVRHVDGRAPVAEVAQPPVPAPAPLPPQPPLSLPAPAPHAPAPPPAEDPPSLTVTPSGNVVINAPVGAGTVIPGDRTTVASPRMQLTPWGRVTMVVERVFRERRGTAVAALAALGVAAAAAAKLLGLFTIEVEIEPELDVVDCTVFAPPEAVAGKPILVQVFVHLPVQEADARALATEFDETATRRAVQGLETEVARGSKLSFALRIPGADVDEPVASLVWRGRPAAVQFGATMPAESGTLIATVSVTQDSIPIGHVKFKLEVRAAAAAVDARPAPAPAPVLVGDGASRYRSAFLSYASEDRAAVIRGAQMLRSVGITFFQDVVDLDPGERWEQRLYAEIERNDLFLLFWSRAAHDSEWVRREARFALDCASGDFERPEIKPVILERPPSAPWPELAHLHFNDPLAYFVDAGGRS